MEPAAKRLRGWQKDMEKHIHRPLAKGSENQSALCTKLLQLWSTGRLSATAVQELAHCAVLDGADHAAKVETLETIRDQYTGASWPTFVPRWAWAMHMMCWLTALIQKVARRQLNMPPFYFPTSFFGTWATTIQASLKKCSKPKNWRISGCKWRKQKMTDCCSIPSLTKGRALAKG